MSNDSNNSDSQPQEDWELYLQVFLDESDDDLDALVQALLSLEKNSDDVDSLNEAFRLLHTHKGSAGLMGFEGISHLAHELESRFEQIRSGEGTLDRDRITALLRCVDFLRRFNAGMRSGDSPSQDASEVLAALESVERDSLAELPDISKIPTSLPSLQGGYRVRVEFEPGLQLADMKARLIVARLSNIGEIIATEPAIEDMLSVDDLSQFVLVVMTDQDPAEVKDVAQVDGVRSVAIEGEDGAADRILKASADGPLKKGESSPPPGPSGVAPAASDVSPAEQSDQGPADEGPADEEDASPREDDGTSDSDEPEYVEPIADFAIQTEIGHLPARVNSDASQEKREPSPPDGGSEKLVTESTKASTPETDSEAAKGADSPNRSSVAETLRVGIDRLDQLMNLTGELVVARARIAQISDQLESVFRDSGRATNSGSLTERCRSRISRIKELMGTEGTAEDWQRLIKVLESDLDAVDQRLSAWEEGRRQSNRIAESVDQLEKVSGSLQQSVLDTRMVPVAPLFSRFNRVIRDLSAARGKPAALVIRGDKTELDKRMIDELGDPLLHLVRNAFDHGLESLQDRRRAGKSETGTITLDATHSGNNVFITISDDGSGLDIRRIRDKAEERGLAKPAALADMDDQRIIEYIWHPGFSTAEVVTDISGRGIGMDVVRNRISDLNGMISVQTTPGQGTAFKIRLPLTLAIIRCLLVRSGVGVFSIPIDDVQEIVAVASNQVRSVHGRETFELRGNYLPLIRMDQAFHWPDEMRSETSDREPDQVNVVILRPTGRAIGLCVDEMLGSGDVVIKSLSDNFVNIRGLSGASIMGDGAVCLMLDPSEIIQMAAETDKPVPTLSVHSA